MRKDRPFTSWSLHAGSRPTSRERVFPSRQSRTSSLRSSSGRDSVESARQLEDVVALLRLRGKAIDQAYIDRWTKALGLGEQWTEVRRRVQPPS